MPFSFDLFGKINSLNNLYVNWNDFNSIFSFEENKFTFCNSIYKKSDLVLTSFFPVVPRIMCHILIALNISLLKGSIRSSLRRQVGRMRRIFHSNRRAQFEMRSFRNLFLLQKKRRNKKLGIRSNKKRRIRSSTMSSNSYKRSVYKYSKRGIGRKPYNGKKRRNLKKKHNKWNKKHSKRILTHFHNKYKSRKKRIYNTRIQDTISDNSHTNRPAWFKYHTAHKALV